MNPNLQIRLEVTLPNNGKRLGAAVQVSEHLFRESFEPLPRDRELPFAVRSRIQAEQQNRMRRDIASTLGEQLADKILELIESEDPRQGYSAEEWRSINSVKP